MAEILDFGGGENAVWDQFVEQSPQGTVFAKSFWLRAFEQLTPENKACVIVVRDANGSIQAGLPLFVSRSGRRHTSAANPPLTAYVSLLLAPRVRKDENREAEWEMRTIGEILAKVHGSRYDRVSLVHAPSLVDIREFTWQGWTVSPRYTYVRSLDCPDFVADLSKNHAKNFRKASRAGYTVSIADDCRQRLDAFLVIFENSYKTVPAAYLPHCHFVRTLLHACENKGTALLYEAKDASGDVQAARIVWLSCRQQVMDWAAATTDTGRADGVTAFLLAKIFEDLRDRGYREFDFCGANMRSIARYKAGFNATLTPYYATSLERPPRLLSGLKTALRPLVARLRKQK